VTVKPTLKAVHRIASRTRCRKTRPCPSPIRNRRKLRPCLKSSPPGFMVVLMEWTCLQLLAPSSGRGAVSALPHIDVSHAAAAVARHDGDRGLLHETSRGKRVTFWIKAHDVDC